MTRPWFIVGVLILVSGALATGVFMLLKQASFSEVSLHYSVTPEPAAAAVEIVQDPPARHIETPVAVKAVYMSQCLASDKTLRSRIVSLVNETELNAIVIDIKDYSGRIAFVSEDPLYADSVSPTCVVYDMSDFIESLHEDGIYVIGRITVFQDPYYANLRPEFAVRKDSDREAVWKDYKGISYLDPGSKDVWGRVVALSRESYRIGFDEINFDYIRFPSDGNMRDIYYPYSEEFIESDPVGGKASILRGFFSYLRKELSQKDGMVISADLFGMTTTNRDDLNIGQILEDALLNFDYVAPMVYPSHYPSGFIGITNPASKPYEVVRYSMDEAVKRSSTTPLKLRPWLQDFHLGADYTPDMVRAQIQAVYDSGLTSWMLWNASNRYTKEALDLTEGR